MSILQGDWLSPECWCFITNDAAIRALNFMQQKYSNDKWERTGNHLYRRTHAVYTVGEMIDKLSKLDRNTPIGNMLSMPLVVLMEAGRVLVD